MSGVPSCGSSPFASKPRKIQTCPNETVSSMHDARDAEDKRLLEAKEHTQLLENYVYLVQEWVSLRVRDRQAADEVAQRVFLRLAKELADGKTYSVPYRVVVWSVVKWTAQGYEWAAKEGATLPDDWDPTGPDELRGVGGRAEPGCADRRPTRPRPRGARPAPPRGPLAGAGGRAARDHAERRRPGRPPRSSKGGGEACCLGPTELFAEYADALARGERPRAADYLDRAGAEADALARMFEGLHKATARPSATAEDSALLAAWLQHEPPLLELRRRQGLKRAAVVDSLLGDARPAGARAASGSPTPTTSSRPASSTRPASTRASGARSRSF